METARQYGISLPDGEQAFLDKQNNTFVDSALHPLNEKDAKEAADEFKLLTPQQQKENGCYVDACRLYNTATDISKTADIESLDIENAKGKLASSNGTMSETEMAKAGQNVTAKEKDLSSRLAGLQNADATLDAALSDDTNAAGATASDPPSNSISFANSVSPNGNITGDGNEKTSTSFNAAARSIVTGDPAIANPVPAPANRLPLVSAP
jgi:hypothetical protein